MIKKNTFLLVILLKINVIYCQKNIIVDTLFKDKMSIRAIVVDKNKVWYAANANRFGFVDFITNKRKEILIQNDSLKMEFRSIAQTDKNIFALCVGNPANLYQIDKKSLIYNLVYVEKNDKVFYDSMQFWNEKEGIAIGDPITDCLSILITRDGGNSWQKTPCEILPKIVDGEAAFAASNTNIIIKKNKTWVVTGGKKARVFFSTDKGISWQVFDTPIEQGQAMTGIFTTDFYDDKIGIIAGGNYEKPNQNFSNKAITIDGGKTWNLIADNEGFGYASCIQFVPKSKGKKLVCVGATGVFFSDDFAKSWHKIMNDTDFYTITFIDKKSFIAAGKSKMIKIDF